jgi:regulator of sirC expression with transglutaminase-like and TPR domain
MLNNLKSIYVRQERFDKALPVIDKLLIIDPVSAQERRDRGLVLVRLKRFSEAKVQLAKFLEICPVEESTQEARDEANQLLDWLNKLN